MSAKIPTEVKNMSEYRLKDVCVKLASVSVFEKVLEKPIFKSFFKYMSERATDEEKIRNYSAFVSLIYEGGADLSKIVARCVFEDENVYVKSVAQKKTVNEKIVSSVKRELEIFSEFASLTSRDFASDIGAEIAIADFDSGSVDISKEYKERLENISSYGYGIFSSNPMFRISKNGEAEPICEADKISLDDFIGYEAERGEVIKNTRSFVDGYPAANVLLYGDAGTGKSSTVKAVANEFYKDGVRLIELRKDQLFLLPEVMDEISGNPLKFIIFIDDLSFEKSDDNFNMLKAALEGSATCKAENAVIYATSNRRHIVRETFSDRDGDDVHRNDTVQEALSLSERFGLTVSFYKPDKKLYLKIVSDLAKKNGIEKSEAELDTRAEAFALKRGYRSARCAEQFIDSLMQEKTEVSDK